MAASVVSLPLPQPHDLALSGDNPTEARKRRREILASHRHSTMATTPEPSASAANVVVVVVSGEPTAGHKKRRVSNCSDDSPALVSPVAAPKQTISTTTKASVNTANASSSGSKAKKPQMKYDPDVPMTKEEAAVWRREQRRKRNRESAAASRQRQRDRIVELEAEVEEWKAKFDEAMKRIRQLEEAAAAGGGAPSQVTTITAAENKSKMEMEPVVTSINSSHNESSSDDLLIHSPEALVEEVFKDTTIVVSPSQSPRSVSPAAVDFPQVQAIKVVSNVGTSMEETQTEEQGEETQQPTKMISRPA